MWAAIKAAHERVRGYRTLIVAAVVFTIDTLQATDLAPLLPPSWLPWWGVAHPLIFGYLRLITTGRVGGGTS